MVRIRSVEINQFIQAQQHMGESFEAIGMGFAQATVGAMVRSSYHADRQAAGAGVSHTV